MDIARAFTYVTEDENWQNKVLITLIIGVVRDGTLAHLAAAGTQPPPDADLQYRIGSITKTFIWTAVMQLVEQGLIDLDADVNTYLDFEIPGQPITMLDLMAHAPGFHGAIINTNARTVDDLQALAAA